MENKLQRNIVWFFGMLLLISFMGFYPTYLIKAPTFEGFKTAHHFHGIMALSWIILLIVQTFLIRTKNFELHRKVGKLSYLVMPLLMISLFFVAKATFEKNITILSKHDALAAMTNGLPEILYFGFLYTMAMIYRKQTGIHMRFMACTGIMMLGPGLGRMLIVGGLLPIPIAIVTIIALTALLPLIWFIFDIKNKKPLLPLGSYMIITLMAIITNSSSHSAWWQSFADWFSQSFF